MPSYSGNNIIQPTSTLPRNLFNSRIQPSLVRTPVVEVCDLNATKFTKELKKIYENIREIEMEILKLEEQILHNKQDITTLQKTQEELQQKVSDLSEKVTSLETGLKNVESDVSDLQKETMSLQDDVSVLQSQMIQITSSIQSLQKETEYLELKTNFVDVIQDALSYLTDLNSLETFELSDVENWLQSPNDLKNKIYFYMRYHQPSIFINLIISVLFRTVVTLSTDINFQGANSQVRYFSVNIFPISTIFNNVPIYTYPSTDYWSVISIDTRGPWVDDVQFFSFTPYLAKYTDDSKTTTYLANCNISLTSTLIKANDPEIFSSNRGKIFIFYTFNTLFRNLLHNPSKNRYAFLLPSMIDSSSFTVMTRFEKKQSVTSINFVNTIKAFSFSELPYFIPSFNSRQNEETASKEKLQLTLNKYPVISSSYEKNKENIESFLSTVKNYNDTLTPLKIYPYFYLSNQNKVVTNVYNMIDDKSECNALYNDFNKNYYNSEIITIRDSDGNLTIKSFKLIALNHVLSGYSTSNNIQVYNVKTQKSIETIPTSSELPFLSDASSASSTYDVSQSTGIYTIDIDLTSSEYDGVTEIAFFERVCYPVAFTNNRSLVNSGPRYSSFLYDRLAREQNPSENCTVEDVERNNVYTIESNDENYSLHLNYCKYSTLNFRAYQTS